MAENLVSMSDVQDADDPVVRAFQDYRAALQMLRLRKAIKDRSRKLSGSIEPPTATPSIAVINDISGD